MCAVSMVFDNHANGWPIYSNPPVGPWSPPYGGPTEKQFEEFLELLRSAKKSDRESNRPDCGDEEKLTKVAKILKPAQLKKVREILGI